MFYYITLRFDCSEDNWPKHVATFTCSTFVCNIIYYNIIQHNCVDGEQ